MHHFRAFFHAMPSNVSGVDPLRANHLKTWRTLALSVGIQGPVAGVIVGPAVLASLVGPAGALAYLLGFVAMSFVAYAFVIFSRRMHSAGSVYAFNAAALGPRFGFVSAWTLLLVYISFASAVYASSADIAQNLAASVGVHLPWIFFALAGFVLTIAVAYRPLQYATSVMLVVEVVAVVLLAVVAVAVIGRSGVHHALSLHPFSPRGVSWGALGLGVVNAFGAFSGFEGAAVLGEESSAPHRSIPRAIAASLVGSALVYIFFTWVADNAYASPASLANDPAPFVHLGQTYVGSGMGTAVNIAGVISAFGAQLACVVAANRLIYALGRDVFSPGPFRRFITAVHPRHGTPRGALLVTAASSLALLLAFSTEPTAVRALTLIVEYGAYLIILAYLLTVGAAAVWVVRQRGSLRSLLALLLGVLVLGVVVYDTFHPWPPAPYSWIIATAALSVTFGVALSRIPGVSARLHDSPVLLTYRPSTPPLKA